MLKDEPVTAWCVLHYFAADRYRGRHRGGRAGDLRARDGLSYVQSFSCPVSDLETAVIGEEGSLRLKHQELHEWRVAGRPAPEARIHPNRDGSDKPEATFLAIEELLKTVEANCAPSNSGRDNLGTMAFLGAAYRSAEDGGPVSLPSELVR
jgi:predicted dehydrogenase